MLWEFIKCAAVIFAGVLAAQLVTLLIIVTMFVAK